VPGYRKATFSNRLVGGLRLALGDVRLQPFEAIEGPGDPLQIVEQRDGGRDLLVHLSRERDRHDHVADAALPADGIAHDEQDTGHVARREGELPGRAQGHSPDLGPPQRARGLLP
jgi:hypothetical protein